MCLIKLISFNLNQYSCLHKLCEMQYTHDQPEVSFEACFKHVMIVCWSHIYCAWKHSEDSEGGLKLLLLYC